MKLYTDFDQYSSSWWAVRRGVPTASEFHRVITAAKGELSAAHKGYIAQLIGDELDPDYPHLNDGASVAMRRGTALEPRARDTYEFLTQATPRQVAFITTDCGSLGCSVDALCGDDGVLELKCPMPETHVSYVLNGTLPADYKAQCHGHLIVTGRKWVDFMSYLPDREPFVVRVYCDEFTEKLRLHLRTFHALYQDARARFGLPYTTEPIAFERAADLAGAV